ncbi:MAG: cyclic nucleotide-binding domain-containing protein, partial [Actinomycetota bacterium]
VLRTIGRGESFGELGLVDGSSRTASVRARADSQLFEVDKGTFDRLLADVIVRPDFAPTFQAVAELRHLPAFATLGADDLAKVLEHGAWLSFAPGSAIIQQGEDADAFYAILSGQADVLQDDRHLRTMGPGSHFGEIALLMDVPRTASMVARTPMRVFRLDRRGFEQVVAAAFRRGTLRSAAAIDRTWQH